VLYNKNISTNHLDVAVGNGYVLDRIQPSFPLKLVALMDVNQNTLNIASERISRYKAEVYLRNVLEPISIDEE